jgi:hypothetical protein
MTTHKFNLAKQQQLQALFHRATLNLNAAARQQRNIAAQLQAEIALARLFRDNHARRPL